MYEFIKKEIESTYHLIEKIKDNIELIEEVQHIGKKCVEALAKSKKILFAGNGGSAADSQHLAAELVSRLQYDRAPLQAIALTTDTSIITAIGNDYGFENIFSRQLDAIGNEGDIFFAISTSGNSKNIIQALEKARQKNIFSVGMTGESGGKMSSLCDLMIKVPSSVTHKIQEGHIMLGHILCAVIEDSLFGNKDKH